LEHIIWTSKLDLSKEHIASFCKDTAPRYGKREEELLTLPLLELASCYMWNERRRLYQEAVKTLSQPCEAPILVISDIAEALGDSHRSCFILSGETIADIFKVREGLVTTFYSDGNDIRCEDITENGANFYLFREVTNPRGLHDFAESIRKGEPFTESELDQYSRSLVPKVHALFHWPTETKSLNDKIESARTQVARNNKIVTATKER